MIPITRAVFDGMCSQGLLFTSGKLTPQGEMYLRLEGFVVDGTQIRALPTEATEAPRVKPAEWQPYRGRRTPPMQEEIDAALVVPPVQHPEAAKGEAVPTQMASVNPAKSNEAMPQAGAVKAKDAVKR